jgi:hypothetical protein
MFPDWEWCGNTGTPKFRGREQILAGALKDENVSGYGDPIYIKKIGSLIHYGRFKHYGESDCLGYSGGWSQADTDSYIKQGHDVKVIDGWEIVKHGSLDTEDVFNSLSESTLKRIIRESIEEFDWVGEIPKYDLEGFYMTKPIKSYSGLIGNLVFMEKIEGEHIGGLGDQFFVWMKAVLMRRDDMPENEFPTEQDYIQFIKHEMEHVKHDLTTISNNWGEPQKVSESSIIQLVSDRYFIRLS